MTVFETAAREHISSRGSKDTRGIYMGDLARWLLFCGLEQVDPDMPPFSAAVKFRDQLLSQQQGKKKKPLAGLTVRRILSALSAMYTSAGLVNHFASGKRLHRPLADTEGQTDVFSVEEVTAIFHAVADHPRDAAIVRILHDSGLRISEVLAIHRDRLLREDGQLYLIGKVKKKGRVTTELTEACAEAIERWLAVAPASAYLFPGRNSENHLGRSHFSVRLVEIGKLAGVTKVHPHRFRSTYITTALNAGVPLHEIQAAVHHSEPKTTQRYDKGVRGRGVAAAVAEYRRQPK